MLRGSCYTAPCRWYVGGPVGRIRYYRVPATNRRLTGRNAFYPRYEDLDKFRNATGTGEVVGRTAPSPATDFRPDLDGADPCGTADDFAGLTTVPLVQPAPPRCRAGAGRANVLTIRAAAHRGSDPLAWWSLAVQFLLERAEVTTGFAPAGGQLAGGAATFTRGQQFAAAGGQLAGGGALFGGRRLTAAGGQLGGGAAGWAHHQVLDGLGGQLAGGGADWLHHAERAGLGGQLNAGGADWLHAVSREADGGQLNAGGATFAFAPGGAGASTWSLALNGSTGWVDLGTSTVIRPVAGAPFTWALWLKGSAIAAASAFMANWNAGVGVILWTNAGTVFLGDNNAVALGWVGGLTVLNDGAWHHLAVTYDGTTSKIWCDGTVRVSGIIFGGINPGTTRLTLGAYANGGAGYLAGKIDDVAVYAADKSSDIPGIAAGTTDPATLSPVGIWRLEEGAGTTTADGSGNGNAGTLNGGVTWSSDVPAVLV